ncbi:TIGR00725 family protein [Patescibacteria group bacterium]|nr:TIGR00725 family protein [Patescibacteria group bacterium]
MTDPQSKLQIAVIGPAGLEEYPRGNSPKESVYKTAERVGFLLAKKGVTVVTGGKGGVMESAARGARRAGGLTAGIVSGAKRFVSNRFMDVEFLTGSESPGLDELFVVLASDGIISLGGGAGTLEELSVAYRNKKPVVAINGTGGWSERLSGEYLDERKTMKIEIAKDAEEAVGKIILLIRNKNIK